MGKPKKRRSHRRTGTARSAEVVKLGRKVNATSPVKVRTTIRESGRKHSADQKKVTKVTADA